MAQAAEELRLPGMASLKEKSRREAKNLKRGCPARESRAPRSLKTLGCKVRATCRLRREGQSGKHGSEAALRAARRSAREKPLERRKLKRGSAGE
jgi:hypothetical protein